MNVYHDESGLGKKVCIALGMFDGVHRAHMDIMQQCAEFAEEKQGNSFVYTFHTVPKPRNNGDEFIILTTLEQKLQLIEQTGIQNAIVMNFDGEYAKATHEQFLRRLCKGRRVKAIFCGYDFRFGHQARGDIEYLKEMSSKMRYRLFVTEPVLFEGEQLSSSRIRQELLGGDFEKATQMLGRPYTARMVVHSRNTSSGNIYQHGVFADFYNLANGTYIGEIHTADSNADCEIYVYNKTIRVTLRADIGTPRDAELVFVRRNG